MSDLTDNLTDSNVDDRRGDRMASSPATISMLPDPVHHTAALTMNDAPGLVHLQLQCDTSVDPVEGYLSPSPDGSGGSSWGTEQYLYVADSQTRYIYPSSTPPGGPSQPYDQGPVNGEMANSYVWTSSDVNAGEATIMASVPNSFLCAPQANGQLNVVGTANSNNLSLKLIAAIDGATVELEGPVNHWTPKKVAVGQTISACSLPPNSKAVFRAVDANQLPLGQCTHVDSDANLPPLTSTNSSEPFCSAQIEFTNSDSTAKVVIVVMEDGLGGERWQKP